MRPIMRLRKHEQISFADYQRQQQGILLNPEMQAISDFLDSLPELTELVRKDLVRGIANPGKGRPGMTAECVLRSLVLWRMKNWTYRELRERIADDSLRDFTRFHMNSVPLHHAFQRAFSRLRPQTIQEINDRVMRAVEERGLAKGNKLRIDATVVSSNILYPTDGGLLSDTVRVLTRLTKALGELSPEALEGFHDRTRCAKKRAYEIQRLARGNKKTKMRSKYQQLIRVAEEVLAASDRAVDRVRKSPPGDLIASLRAESILVKIQHFGTLGRRVVDQTRRRVLHDEVVPAREKLVSLFEPHADIIVRKKAGKPVEFGHKTFFAETEGGFIILCEVVDGNPPDVPWATPALEKHIEVFGHAPKVYAGDRGFYSKANVALCAEAGVETESFPYRGSRRPDYRTPHEKSPAFKDAQRFRNGVEGRISVMARGRGTGRCPLHGRTRCTFYVLSAVLANNLKRTAAAIIESTKGKRSPRVA